jgi:hypothetical protein
MAAFPIAILGEVKRVPRKKTVHIVRNISLTGSDSIFVVVSELLP